MKNIAVLGAGGFIGRNTAEYLKINKNYKVFAITRKNIDLLDEEMLRKFFEEERIDVIIHCANQGGTRKSAGGQESVVENNLRMFFNAERCLNSNMRLINFGSGAQYDKGRNLIKVREEEFGQKIPKDEYGYSKYVMSKYINMRKNEGILLNPILFGLYGFGEDYTYRFISNAILKNILEMPIVINQDVVFDYLFIEDYYQVLDRLIEDEWTEIEFNLTPTDSIRLTEIADIINSIGGYTSEITVKNSGMNFQYTGDNSRLINCLDSEITFTSYEEGIKKLYRQYLEHIDEIDVDAVRKDSFLNMCTAKE